MRIYKNKNGLKNELNNELNDGYFLTDIIDLYFT